MNERIKELAEQAGLEFDNDLTLESEPIYYLTQVDLKKFAKLIVRECMDNLAWHGHDEAVSQLQWFLSNKFRG
jgi:hypothetical protein